MRKHAGFTMLEMIVAMVLFAAIGTVVFTLYATSVKGYLQTKKYLDEAIDVNTALDRLAYDIEQAVTTRADYTPQGPFTEGGPVSITLLQFPAPTFMPTLVRYFVRPESNGQVSLFVTKKIGDSAESEPMRVLRGGVSINFDYFSCLNGVEEDHYQLEPERDYMLALSRVEARVTIRDPNAGAYAEPRVYSRNIRFRSATVQGKADSRGL